MKCKNCINETNDTSGYCGQCLSKMKVFMILKDGKPLSKETTKEEAMKCALDNFRKAGYEVKETSPGKWHVNMDIKINK